LDGNDEIDELGPAPSGGGEKEKSQCFKFEEADSENRMNSWRLLRDYDLEKFLNPLRERDSDIALVNVKVKNNSLCIWILMAVCFSIIGVLLSQRAKLQFAQMHRLKNEVNIKNVEHELVEFKDWVHSELSLNLPSARVEALGFFQRVESQVVALKSEFSTQLTTKEQAMDEKLDKMSKDYNDKLNLLSARIEELVSKVNVAQLQAITNAVDELQEQIHSIARTNHDRFHQIGQSVESIQDKTRQKSSAENPHTDFINYARHIVPRNCTLYYPSPLHQLQGLFSSLDYSIILRPSKLLGESISFDTSKSSCTLEIETGQPLMEGIFEVAHHVASPGRDHTPKKYMWEVKKKSKWEEIGHFNYDFQVETQGKQHVKFELAEAATQFRITLLPFREETFINLYTIQILADPRKVESCVSFKSSEKLSLVID